MTFITPSIIPTTKNRLTRVTFTDEYTINRNNEFLYPPKPPILQFQFDPSSGPRRARLDSLFFSGGMAELYKDGALPRELPLGRHQHDGRCGQPNSEGAHRVGHHPRGPPEEDHEQCAEHQGPDPRERLRGFPGIKRKVSN